MILMINIYENKNYKLFVLIPIALMLISIYFIPKIQLDSSLRGGITVTVQANSTVNVQSITSQINAKLPGAQTSIESAPGGIAITIADNSSISNANNYLLNAYNAYSNYSQAQLGISEAESLLQNQPSNNTLVNLLHTSQSNLTIAGQQINSSIKSEFAALSGMQNNISENFSSPDAMINSGSSAINIANNNYKTKVLQVIHSLVPFTTYSYNTVTPTLGSFFLGQLQGIIIASFVLVAIAVFIVFRTVIPSFAVVFGAVNDIIIALGAMGLFGIPLGIASIGGILMLIGYSIDTDILSAIRILKRHEHTPEQRAFDSMKTGITITATALIVFVLLFAVSYVSFIQTYFEIAGVVIAGLVGDLITTWLGDTVMVLWYKKRSEKQ